MKSRLTSNHPRSCVLKLLHEVLLTSYEAKSPDTIPSYGQNQPMQFLSCEFSVLRERCAYCQSCGQTSQTYEVLHKTLLPVGSQTSFILPPG
jgi:hypothetical protein